MKLSLYIHIPFCTSKCPYCSFFSIVPDNKTIIENYIDAMKDEISIYSKKYPEIEVQSIYIGGGTPTILTCQQIDGILKECHTKFHINKEIEITIESNPATFDFKKAQGFLYSGINRLSIGAQSFSDKLLKDIGRIHDRKDIIKSYQLARKAGFNNINIDLMFGLPGQSLKQFSKTLDEVNKLRPEHLSIYGLSIEKGTIFSDYLKKGLLKLPTDDIVYKMYKKTIGFLRSNGYEHYEISNFSIPDRQCFHNKIYWKNKQYLGLGASATSYIDKKRYKNINNVNKYIYLLKYNILPVRSKEILPIKEEMSETIILHLRMMKGIAKSDFFDRFNFSIDDIFGKQLDYLKKEGLLKNNKTHYFLTEKGIFLSNLVFIEFLD